MRGGFLARTGLTIGQMAVSHGYGGIGTIPIDTTPVTLEESLIPGRKGPRAVPENKQAPTVLVYQPGAKRKRGQ
jgi:hypothetical protein